MTDTLQQIRDLQFTDKTAAEALLLSFVRAHFPELKTASVELIPKPTSLNSFNGFLTQQDGTRRFFKTHTEANTIINEYYNAELLARAGYPVIQPIFRSTEPGKQFLVYEVIEDRSVFDMAWEIENGDETLLPALTEAQHRADDELLNLYLATSGEQTAEEAARAPVHQLFYHRLSGGRFAAFYGNALPGRKPRTVVTFGLPLDSPVPVTTHTILHERWKINGVRYGGEPGRTLYFVIKNSGRHLWPPDNPSLTMYIIGHGDAHNGNVFFRADERKLTYFDPAFAGKHHPLLDIAKPLFHNVFAMWMYFPHDMLSKLRITMNHSPADGIVVEYDYPLHPVRLMFFESKIQRVLIPLLQALKARKKLPAGWRRILKTALFCCPFLTMNLADSQRFPPEISLLGLAMSVEMGAESRGERSLIDKTLDEVEKAL